MQATSFARSIDVYGYMSYIHDTTQNVSNV
jgi:hypothetical protein